MKLKYAALPTSLFFFALVNSFSPDTWAAIVHVDPDPESITCPSIPDSCVITDLPSATSVGRKGPDDCFSSYYIETVILDRSPDRRITYGIRIANIGGCTLNDLVVTDFFPIPVLFGGVAPTPKVLRPNSVSWIVPSLEVGQSTTFSIQFIVAGLIDDGPHTTAELTTLSTAATTPPSGSLHTENGHDGWMINTACIWNSFLRQPSCAWIGDQVAHDHH